MNKDQKKYLPMMVGFSREVLFSEEKIKMWDKFHVLPIKTQDILKSDEIVDFIYGIEQRFRLKDEQTEKFSLLVRKYFFREMTESGFAKEIATLCKISPDEALKLLQAINVIEPGKKEREEQIKNIVKIPLNKAISQYPQILDQVITSQSIISKPFLKPLKPTVKNWIMVYEKVLDVSKHDALERGEFIFRSEATKNISDEEEQKLSLLLKSRDEDSEIMIDSVKGEIVFILPQKEKPQEKTPQIKKTPVTQAPVKKVVPQKPLQKKPVDHIGNSQKATAISQQKTVSPIPQKPKSFDMITPIRSVTDAQIKDKKLENEDIKKEKPTSAKVSKKQVGENSQKKDDVQKGIFGTKTYLPKKTEIQDRKKEMKIVGSAAGEVSVQKKIDQEKEVIQKKTPTKDDALQNAAGEIEHFTKNVVKRPEVPKINSNVITQQNKPVEISIDDQEKIDQEMGKKKKRTIGILKKKEKKPQKPGTFETTSGKVLIENEQDRVSAQIEKEQKELARATEKMNKLISEMQENVSVPRSIGQEVKEKKRVSLQKEHGDIQEEIKQNRRDLYGEVFVEEDVVEPLPHKEKEERKEEEKKNEKNTEIVKEVESNEKNIEKIDGGDITFDEQKSEQAAPVKKDDGVGEMTFSSNHLLPSEKEKEQAHEDLKGYFNISPIGHVHDIGKEKEEENKVEEK